MLESRLNSKCFAGHKGLALAIASFAGWAFLAAPALAQTAPAAAPGAPSPAALQMRSQQLEQELFDEHRKLQDLENQFYNLRKQMQELHQANIGKTTGQKAAVKPGQKAPIQSAQSSNQPGNHGGVNSLRAAANSRKTPATSLAVKTAYQQEHALFQPGLTFYPQFQYSYSNSRNLVLNGFLAFNAILLGSINVSQNQVNIFNWNPYLYYALSRHFELDVNVPYFFEQAEFKSIGASNSTGKQSKVTVSKWGIGDVTGGFYWQVLDQHGYWPNVIWNTQVSAPTGTSPYGIKLLTDPSNTNLKYPENLPTGKGVWGVSSGLSIIREFDPVVLFASGNYYYEFTQNVDDISTIPGKTVPGEVAPGNAMAYTLGVSTAINERLSTLVEVQDIITNSSEIKPKGGFWSTVPDSDTNAAQFVLGVNYAASHNFFPYVQAGIGATTSAPNFQISLWAPYYFPNTSLF